jgi:hypothetical protein
MTQPDPAMSTRDLRTLSEEYQTVGADLVEDLYWHLVDRNGRGVSIDEAREYIGRLTARFRREILRTWLDHLEPGPFARANRAEHVPRGTVDDARGSAPGRVDPPPVRSDRAQRQSLDGQDPPNPNTAYLLSRAAGLSPAGFTNAELLARATGRHVVTLPPRRVAPPTSESPPPARLAEVRREDRGEPLADREPPDFLGTPDARLLAQAVAFQARHNADRLRRARLVAPAYLREALSCEPSAVEVEAWANTLFSRNDTVIDVDSLESTVAEPAAEAVPSPRRGPGRPGWTRDVFEAHWREAVAATPRPHTFRALAEHFRSLDGLEGGVGGDHLRRLRRVRFRE